MAAQSFDMDMSETIEYKFVQGPSRSQNERIDPDLWEQYKAIIIEKREMISLPEVMLFMKEKYGFTAT